MRPSGRRHTIAVAATLVALASCTTARMAETPAPAVVRGQTWDYVVLGNSVGTLWSRNYGAHLEADLAVKIVYHDYYVASQQLGTLWRTIAENGALREDIKAAEVITIGCGSSETAADALNYSTGAYDRAQLQRRVAEFKRAYDSMVKELLKIASPSRKVIRIVDFYCPSVAKNREHGMHEPIRDHYLAVTGCIARSGRRYGIPVACVFAAFNGPDGNDDPLVKGYVADDGRHPSDLGKEVIAGELRKFGYRYTLR
jgi:hypothetical protein